MSLLIPQPRPPRRQQTMHTCSECGYVTPRRRAYEKHMRACTSAHCSASSSGRSLPDPPVCRNYRCHHCGSCTNKAKLFLYHLRDVHGENMSVFACDLCEYASRHKHKVFRHRKLVHKGVEPLTDLLPLDSGDSQDGAENGLDDGYLVSNTARVQYAEVDSDQFVERMEEDEMGSSELKEEEEEELDEAVIGAYIVKPEAVDEDIRLLVDSGAQQIDQAARVAFDSIQLHGGDVDEKKEEGSHHHRHLYSGSCHGCQSGEHSMFKCRLCSYTNPYKWKIAQHARTIHMRKTLFRCQQCDFACERKIEWCVHKTKHSKKAVHACHECAYRTTMKRNFDRHMRRHRNGGPIKCSICSYASTGEAAVQRHMAEFHPSQDGKQEGSAKQRASTYTLSPRCKIRREYGAGELSPTLCANAQFSSPYLMSQSEDFAGSEVEEDESRPLTIDVRSITDDVPSAHGSTSSASQQTQYTCRFCQVRFRELSILKNHVIMKHGDEAVSGDISGWNARTQDLPLNLSRRDDECAGFGGETFEQDEPLDLSVQKQNNSSGQQEQGEHLIQGTMKCPHCNYNASWPSDLQRHMMVHSLERRYRCYLCGRRYKHQFDLNAHLRRVHCVPAGRSAAFNGGGSSAPVGTSHILGALLQKRRFPLVNKIDIPVREKVTKIVDRARTSPTATEATTTEKLRCEFCNYVGKYQAEVLRHMRLHTGDKPFACLFCSYRSFWKGDMKRHLVKHHPKEVDGCEDLKSMVNETERLGQNLRKKENFHNTNSKHNVPIASDDINQPSSPPSSATLWKEEENDVEDLNPKKDEDCFEVPLPLTASLGAERQVFKCTQCPFQCDAPSKLKCHAEIHANLKRFKCPLCGKRSNWTWDIRKHIRKDHANVNVEVIELSEKEAKETLLEYVSTHRTCGRSSSESKESTPIRENMQASMQKAKVSEPVKSDVISTLEGSDAAEDGSFPLRPFKCSECPKRSNWKWDIQKHIRQAHVDTGGKVVVFKGQRVPVIPDATSKRQHASCRTGGASTATLLGHLLKPRSLQPSDLIKVSTERCRPFQCSSCGKRSNWKWDLNKHIASSQCSSAHIVTLTEEEARLTFDDYLKTQQKEKGTNAEEEMSNFSAINVNKRMSSTIRMLSHRRHGRNSSSQMRITTSHQSKDFKMQKKFKCSICIYRSNYRSDIQRHLKRRHGRNSTALVVELTDKEAAETLAEYRKMCGAKKFTLPEKVAHSSENGDSSNELTEDACGRAVKFADYLSSNNESVKSDSNSEGENEYSVCESYDETETACSMSSANKRKILTKFGDCSNEAAIDNDEKNEPWVKVSVLDAPLTKARGRHFCEWCPYVSINKNDYIYHKQFHRAKTSAPFKCDRCPYWVTQKRLLKQHEKVHQPEYKLRYYPTSRIAAERLVGSSEETAEKSISQTSLLNTSAELVETDDTMDYDLQNSHLSPKEKASSHDEFDNFVPDICVDLIQKQSNKCASCPYWSSSLNRLREHETRHVTNSSDKKYSPALSCCHCDYNAISDESLSIHVGVHLQDYQPGVDPGSDADDGGLDHSDGNKDEWKCNLCSFHSMKYTQFEKHLLLHRTQTWIEHKTAQVNCDIAVSKHLTSVSNDIFSTLPADIAAAADLTSASLLEEATCENSGDGLGESNNDANVVRADRRRGAPIFPGLFFEENTGHNNSTRYDLNANLLTKLQN